MKQTVLFWGMIIIGSLSLHAQSKLEPILYGDMDHWVDRQIKESSIIGGETKHVYAIGPTRTITTDEPYKNMGGSPWGSSNVLAKVSGVTKTNTSVFPEKRGNGYCCRLETKLLNMKIAGLANMTVLAAGSVYLGNALEPIKSSKNPQKSIDSGIPFTKKPVAVQVDYKVKLSDSKDRIHAPGVGKTTTVEGRDYPSIILLLQKRWEDAKGNIYAKRVGTMVVRFEANADWHNNATFKILYGDITKDTAYRSSMMRLQVEERYAKNSKGENVPIHEVSWGDESDVPTHLILQATSSHGGAYVGSPGNTLWVDNFKLVY